VSELGGINFTEAGERILTASYTENGIKYTGSLKITVTARPYSLILTAPTKTQYLVGESYATEGLSARVRYSDNAEKALSLAAINFSSVSLATAGDKTVTATYTESGVTLSASFRIGASSVLGDFSQGYEYDHNEGIFFEDDGGSTGYGYVEYDEENKYLKVVGMEDGSDTWGTYTSFGEVDKNLEWAAPVAGTVLATVEIKILLNANLFDLGKGFSLTQAINATEGAFFSERSICFRRYADGIRIGYEHTGISEGVNESATSDAAVLAGTARTLADGWYRLQFRFIADVDGVITVTIALLDESGEAFIVEGRALTDTGSADATLANTSGLRYLWFTTLSADYVPIGHIRVF
jgi:hypothetical protein